MDKSGSRLTSEKRDFEREEKKKKKERKNTESQLKRKLEISSTGEIIYRGRRGREKCSYSLLGGERGELGRGWFLRFRVNYWALGCSQRGLHRRGFLLLAQLLRGFLRDRGNVLYRRQLVPVLLSQMVLHHRVRVVPWTGHLLDVRVDALSVSIVASLFSFVLLSPLFFRNVITKRVLSRYSLNRFHSAKVVCTIFAFPRSLEKIGKGEKKRGALSI